MRGVILAALLLAAVYFGLLVVAPALTARWELRAGLAEALLNTALFATASTALTLPPALVIGYAASRAWTHLTYVVVSFSTAIPHTAVGVLLLPTLASLGLVDTGIAVVIAMWVVSLPLATVAVRGSIASLGMGFEEYLRSLGVTGFRLLWMYVRAAPYSLTVAALLAWLRAFSELGALLIVAMRPVSAGVYIFEAFLKHGVEAVAGASLVLVAIGLSFVALLSVVEGRVRAA